MKFNTKTLHTRYPERDPQGSLRMPVYQTVAYEYENAEGIESAFTGTQSGHVYSRSTNPTIEYLEQVVKNVKGALGVIALYAGMAAISNLILALVQSGDNIITSKHIFGNTYSLFAKTLKSFDIEIISSTKYISGGATAVGGLIIDNGKFDWAKISKLNDDTRKYGE